MTDDDYTLGTAVMNAVPAPDVAYKPPRPKSYRPRIALIGAGAIATSHLDAYRADGLEVAAIMNRTRAKAEARAAEFFPDALVTDSWEDILSDPSIDVVDITPHPADRTPIVEAALTAGKHVLSQKPFVEDLATGERLVALAKNKGVKLAVNQNGRWSPHKAWMREAVNKGLIGDLLSCHASIHWDHNWIADTPFNDVPNLILYDFGVHWFDFVVSLFGGRTMAVTATETTAQGQVAKPPLLGQAMIRVDGGQASVAFDGATTIGGRDTTTLTGTKGMIQSDGPNLGEQTIKLFTEEGVATPHLEGTWFNDGFRGTMGELLCAIEEDRDPINGAEANLQSLALTFAAVESARTGREVAVGSVRSIPS